MSGSVQRALEVPSGSVRGVRAGLLVDGTGREPQEDVFVEIGEDGRLGRVVPQRGCGVSREHMADWSSYTVLPGLVNAHTHLSLTPKRRQGIMEQLERPWPLTAVDAFLNALDDLRAGITTERALGDSPGLEIALRDAIAQGRFPGPRLLVAGEPLRPGHGGGTGPWCADGPWEARRQVRRNIAAGVDWIKVFATNIRPGPGEEAFRRGDLTSVPAYTREEIEAIVQEANRSGVPVAAHAFGGPALTWCLEAGVRTIEHANNLEEKDIPRFVASGAYLSDPNLQGFFDPETGFSSRPTWHTLPEWWRQRVEQVRRSTQSVLPKALAAGVPFALGTDSNHGRLWREAHWFVEALGADAMQAIRAVTAVPAEALGVGDRVGTVEEGKVADLVAVDGDPTRSVGDLAHVVAVMQAGAVVPPGVAEMVRWLFPGP